MLLRCLLVQHLYGTSQTFINNNRHSQCPVTITTTMSSAQCLFFGSSEMSSFKALKAGQLSISTSPAPSDSKTVLVTRRDEVGLEERWPPQKLETSILSYRCVYKPTYNWGVARCSKLLPWFTSFVRTNSPRYIPRWSLTFCGDPVIAGPEDKFRTRTVEVGGDQIHLDISAAHCCFTQRCWKKIAELANITPRSSKKRGIIMWYTYYMDLLVFSHSYMEYGPFPRWFMMKQTY